MNIQCISYADEETQTSEYNMKEDDKCAFFVCLRRNRKF